MGEEKEILLRRKVCAYLTGRLMGDPIVANEFGNKIEGILFTFTFFQTQK